MGNESGTWVMYGVDWNDPECLHTVDEAIEYINKVGFLPLFKNEIPGFSLEECTVPEYWWCEDPKVDPWMWLPVFANYRRDGYDFDALYEDGMAPRKHKMIMDNFIEDKVDSEILSNQLKVMAGFGKYGEKGFDGVITTLMMQLYLCNCDFRKRKNKKGQEYGWNVAVYCAPEYLWGYDTVTVSYKEDSKVSWERVVEHMHEIYPIATDKQIRKVLK